MNGGVDLQPVNQPEETAKRFIPIKTHCNPKDPLLE